MSAYFAAETDLTRFFAEQAGVLIEGGEQFIADADGYIRINVACPRATLADGLAKIVAATRSASGVPSRVVAI